MFLVNYCLGNVCCHNTCRCCVREGSATCGENISHCSTAIKMVKWISYNFLWWRFSVVPCWLWVCWTRNKMATLAVWSLRPLKQLIFLFFLNPNTQRAAGGGGWSRVWLLLCQSPHTKALCYPLSEWDVVWPTGCAIVLLCRLSFTVSSISSLSSAGLQQTTVVLCGALHDG